MIALQNCDGFLTNVNMNQSEVYICPLPIEPLAHLPPHHTPLGYRAPVEFPEWYSYLFYIW